jgi:chorismate dehydratase
MRRQAHGEFVLAAVPYSNAAPLVACLAQVDPRVRVVYDYPSRLTEALQRGDADLAMIPVFDFFCHPELAAVGDVGVAADGDVKSVLLKCNRPVPEVRTVARDPASATSNALAELLLRTHFGRDVEMSDAADPSRADAAVVIGDRALCSEPAPAGDIDLAAAWKAMTGMPFVFAVWACRCTHPSRRQLARIVRTAFELGRESLDTIAGRCARGLGLEEAFMRHYLTRCIRHELGEREREGMMLFRRLLLGAGWEFPPAAAASAAGRMEATV